MKTPSPDLEIMAYADGELDAAARAAVEARLQRDESARAELAAWRAVRDGLQAVDPVARVPESREFYWSQIRRRIESPATRPSAAGSVGWAAWWQAWGRWVLPVAAALVVSVVFFNQRSTGVRLAAGAGRMETAATLTFHSDVDGVTIHWIN